MSLAFYSLVWLGSPDVARCESLREDGQEQTASEQTLPLPFGSGTYESDLLEAGFTFGQLLHRSATHQLHIFGSLSPILGKKKKKKKDASREGKVIV